MFVMEDKEGRFLFFGILLMSCIYDFIYFVGRFY
uniref:Lipoprotein n=1 Tax=Rhizophora mucronata TaxID=61149 RepID=A0A2P2PHT0_RHIMU